jgi:hypothetical protein
MFSGHGLEGLRAGVGPWEKVVDGAIEMAVDDLAEHVGDGSTPQSSQFSISVAMIAQFSPAPSAATTPASGDHLNAARRRGPRVKRNIKSRHKPISDSGHQTRRSATQIEGASSTAL